MGHDYIKRTGMGNLISKFIEYSNGVVSVYTTLNGNDIYRGDFQNRAAAEAWFIINGYELI